MANSRNLLTFEVTPDVFFFQIGESDLLSFNVDTIVRNVVDLAFYIRSGIKRKSWKIFPYMIFDILHGQRDNTKLRLFYLTNLWISVFKTSFLLGAAETRLHFI